MSTPATPGSTSTPRELEHTRRQLQDLDALLEQMLALPIAERPEQAGEEWRSPPPPVTPAPLETTLTLTPFARQAPPALEKAVPAEPQRIVTFVPSPNPPPDQEAHVDLLFADHYPETKLAVEVLRLERTESDLSAGDAGCMPDPTVVDVRAPEGFNLQAENLLDLVGIPQMESEAWAAASPGWFHRLLLGIDRLYDHVADFFWPFHRLLKWSGTKSLLGLLGLLLLLGAVGWLVVQSMGWPW